MIEFAWLDEKNAAAAAADGGGGGPLSILRNSSRSILIFLEIFSIMKPPYCSF